MMNMYMNDIFWRIKIISGEIFHKLRVNGHLSGNAITFGESNHFFATFVNSELFVSTAGAIVVITV